MYIFVTEKDAEVGIFQTPDDDHPWLGNMSEHFDKWVEIDNEQLEGVTDISTQVSITGDSEPEWEVVINTSIPSKKDKTLLDMSAAWEAINGAPLLEVPSFDVEEEGAPTPAEIYEWITNPEGLNSFLTNMRTVVESLTILANKVE